MDTKLKELIALKYGKRQVDVEDVNGNIPIYGTGGVFGKANKALYSEPSILIGRKGTIDKPFWVDQPFWCVDTMFYAVIDKTKVIPKYLFYNLSSIDFANYNEGTTIPSLRIDTLNEIVIKLHSPSQQQHIVDILGSIDNSIENNQSIMSNLIRLGKQILQKAYNEQRCVNRCLGDCLCLLKDGTHNPPTRVEKGIPLITGQTIDNGFIVYDKMTYIKESDYKKIHKKYAPAKNDLIITKIGTLGKVAVLRGQDIPIALHCNSALLRFSELSPAVAFFG